MERNSNHLMMQAHIDILTIIAQSSLDYLLLIGTM